MTNLAKTFKISRPATYNWRKNKFQLTKEYFIIKDLVKGIKLNKHKQLWLSDISYLKTKNGTVYLSLITDAYSKKIMGFEFDDNLKAESSKKSDSEGNQKQIVL